jgi:uncharacterized protein YkwD
MRRIAWVALTPLLALIANGCSEEDDGDPVVEIETGGTSTGGAASTGGAVTTGGVLAGGGATGGSPASGGRSSGGQSSAGQSSAGQNNAGSPSGGKAGTVDPTGGTSSGGASGGRFGFGGRGGRSGSGGSGNASTGGTPEPAECSLVRDGATGDEPNGEIPVCCAPSVAEATAIEEVFNLLNAHRMDNGVGALEYDDLLESAIQGHCLHMSQHTFFDHEAEEDGVVLPWDRAELCGTSANGENIAQGQRSPADVMEAWIESPGHNENMLNPRFTRVGIGYVAQGRYWGQIFGQ